MKEDHLIHLSKGMELVTSNAVAKPTAIKTIIAISYDYVISVDSGLDGCSKLCI